jgi:CubicO group peptidase (beta-lactamase class C family)
MTIHSPLPSLASLLILAGVAAACSQPASEADPRVDEIFARWDSPESPGCALSVAIAGDMVLSHAWGMADLEHGIPNTPSTIFEGGSLAKQFTSAAVVLLALDGKLSLDDDVRTYIPEVRDYGTPVTLRRLMTHTSGMRDWGSVASISGWGRGERSHRHAHVLDIVSRQSALNFEPGHEYSYSNTGYNLLAVVVDRVSGMPFAEFSRERIFEPLGMSDTQWRDDYRRLVPRRSTAYSAAEDGFLINRPIEYVHGNGGILSTVGDLQVWNAALTDGRLGGEEFVRMMHDRATLNDGRRISYAGGLQLRDFAGVPSITHTGSTAGYRGFIGRYPDQQLSIAILCNVGNANPGALGGQVARVFLGDAASPDPEPGEGMSLSAGELEAKAGLYREVDTGDPLRIALEDGALRVGNQRLIAHSASEFQVGASERRLVFADAADGRRAGIDEYTGEYYDNTYEPIDEFAPVAGRLDAYTGTFHSDDAETTLVVAVEEGRLVAKRRPDAIFELEPVYEDAFDAGGLGRIRFDLGADGRAGAFGIRQGRVYDMRFQRVADSGE